jgi:hypothetical protein
MPVVQLHAFSEAIKLEQIPALSSIGPVWATRRPSPALQKDKNLFLMYCTEGYSLHDVILDTRAPRGSALFRRYEALRGPIRGRVARVVPWTHQQYQRALRFAGV